MCHVRDKEIVGDGRSILTDSGVEIDPITYAIGTAAKRGTPLVGGVIYTTRYRSLTLSSSHTCLVFVRLLS